MCAWALASGVPCSVFTEYYNPSSICGWNTSMTPSPSRPPCETTPHRGGALTPAHITHPLTRGDNSHRPWFQHSHGHPMLARPRTIELENSLTNSKTVSIFELENSLTNSKTSLSKQRPRHSRALFRLFLYISLSLRSLCVSVFESLKD